MNRLILAAAIALSLGACATHPAAEAEVALTTAEKLAFQYVTLPACPSTTGALCSDAAIVAKIKAADNIAYAAVKGYENGTVPLSTATAAIGAISALIP